MIKAYDRTPEWIYELSKIAGSFANEPLHEAVQQAVALRGHVAVVDEWEDYDPYNNESRSLSMGLMPPVNEIVVEVQWSSGGRHSFGRVSGLEIFIQPVKDGIDNYFICFKAQDGIEMKWFAGKPVRVEKNYRRRSG